jgi:hypothetical protein
MQAKLKKTQKKRLKVTKSDLDDLILALHRMVSDPNFPPSSGKADLQRTTKRILDQSLESS